MREFRSPQSAGSRRSRTAILLAVAFAALLSGCVVYPGYYGPPHERQFSHGRDWR
jgi:hypothetical protein